MPAMLARHDNPNCAFRNLHGSAPWIELYHSRPSWKISQISYRADDGDWIPFGKFQLIAADNVRPGFRVFRTKAASIEFRLADERAMIIDSNMGRNYLITSPGRYVVESGHGCRRVSDANIADCLRPSRPKDRFIELVFHSNPLWRKCFVTFRIGDIDDPTWHKVPMEASDVRYGHWFQRIEAPDGITCAFTDGSDQWDSNQDQNYRICLPGKYLVGAGSLLYAEASALDVHLA